MQQEERYFHYTCTLDEAREITDSFEQHWISNCECREKRGPCKRSGIFLCLQFKPKTAATGTGIRPVTRTEIDQLFEEAKKTHLVTRPFRDENDKSVTDGICFCCDCCCDFFALEDPSPSNKGRTIEVTDMELCNHCGTCEEYCYYKARLWDGEELTIIEDECYGCGICVDVCPEEAITMTLRV